MMELVCATPWVCDEGNIPSPAQDSLVTYLDQFCCRSLPSTVSSFTKFPIFFVRSLMYICDAFAHPHVTSLAVSVWFQPGSLLAVAAPGGRPQKATPKS